MALLIACVDEFDSSSDSSGGGDSERAPCVANAEMIVSADAGKFVSVLLDQLACDHAEVRQARPAAQ